MLSEGVCDVHSLTFTSGATPANLLAASIADDPFSSTYLPAGIGGARKKDLSRHCSQCETGQADAVPTEL